MKETPRFEGAGLSEIRPDDSPTPLNLEHQDRIDPRLAFFACASARLTLIEEGVMSLDEAFNDAFVQSFREIAVLPCAWEREMLDTFEREHLKIREQRLRAWRWRRRP